VHSLQLSVLLLPRPCVGRRGLQITSRPEAGTGVLPFQCKICTLGRRPNPSRTRAEKECGGGRRSESADPGRRRSLRGGLGNERVDRRPQREKGQSATACITAASKASRRARTDVCASRIATSRSLGDTQKCVPYAPLQPKLPSDNHVRLSAGFSMTRTPSPNASPGCLPGTVSGTKIERIISTLRGLSIRTPS